MAERGAKAAASIEAAQEASAAVNMSRGLDLGRGSCKSFASAARSYGLWGYAFAIYSRARASDLASLCSLEVDPGDEPGTGYIEATTFKHKFRQTGNSMGLSFPSHL